MRKTRNLDALAHKTETSLLVTAAGKAHNARDMVHDARRDPLMWDKFNAGLEGSALYLLRMHEPLHRTAGGSGARDPGEYAWSSGAGFCCGASTAAPARWRSWSGYATTEPAASTLA